MVAFELLAGLALLIGGGDLLVRGAVATALRSGVSPLLIGLTIVGFGTSTPELVTSLQAAFAGAPGIAVGNVVGSNIANILLILGISALIAPFAVGPRAFARDGSVMLAAALAVIVLGFVGELGRLTGALLLTALAGYLLLAVAAERNGTNGHAEAAPVAGAVAAPLAWFMIALGIGLTVFGARLLVMASVELATRWGVSDSIIGLTIVAVGTSLPELATSLVAAARRQGDIAFGNIVGSNIFNVFCILGVTVVVHPLAVPEDIARLDVWIMLAATISVGVVALTGWRAPRALGVAWLAAYAGYIWYLADRSVG